MPDNVNVTDADRLDAAEGLIDTSKLRTPNAAPAADPNAQVQKDPDAQNSTGQPTQQPPSTEGNKKPGPVDPIKVDTAFGTSTYGEEDKKLSSWADIVAFTKDEAGIELKDANDLQLVISELKELRAKTEKMSELEKSTKQFQEQLKSLPNEVAAIYDAALNGNHMEAIKKIAAASEIDFSKHFKDQNVLSLVGRYTGRSFTEEAFKDLDPTAKDALMAVAETKYNDERTAYENSVVNRQKNQQAYQQNFKASVDASIDVLKKKFPAFKEDALNHVRQVMEFGVKDSLFTPDNVYKPEAAVRIAMQEFGEAALQVTQKTIGDMAAQMRGRIASETTENILNRNDYPVNNGRQAEMTEDKIVQEAKKATDFLRAR